MLFLTLRLALERAQGAVAVVDQRGILRHWSDGARTLLGWPPKDVVGRRCGDVLGVHDVFGNAQCLGRCPLLECSARGQPVRPFEAFVKDRAGRVRRVVITVTPFGGSDPVEEFIVLLSFVEALPRVGPRWVDPTSPCPASAASAATAVPPSCAAKDDRLERLTAREHEVLDLLATGLDTDALARRLHVSRVTVRNHVQNILRKLEVHTRLEAVARVLGTVGGSADPGRPDRP